MATSTLTSSVPLERFVHALVSAIFAPQRRRAKYAQTIREMAAYSNSELAEFGIARTDIPRIAREAAREI